MAGIAKEVKAEILSKVKAGEKVAKLAQQYGVSEQSIYSWLKGQIQEQVSYREYKRVLKENEDLKKILGVVTLELEKTKKRSATARVVTEKHPEVSRNLAADIFCISRQWLYKKEFVQEHKDAVLKEQILAVLAEHPSYGYRRIAWELGLGKKRVRRCMHKYGLKPYKRKAARWRKRRDEKKKPAPYQNQIKGTCPILPNHTWVGDFTYLPFKGKFLYLATFMDVFTREIVGWQISQRHDKTLVMQAFLDGLVNRDFQKPTYVHTDQGAEYTSQDYTNLVKNFGVTVSMSTKALPGRTATKKASTTTLKQT